MAASPSPAGTLADTGFGQSRRRLLEALKRLGSATLLEVARNLDLSRETVREHVNALAAEGLVARAGTRRHGPGRPHVIYRLTERAEALFPRREGEGLAELARYLVSRGDESVLRRFFAERAEQRLGRARARVNGLSGRKRLEEVARVLSEEGYMAEAADGTLRLAHCPLRELRGAARVPGRAGLALVGHLLGRPLQRTDYRPDGGASCSYRVRGRGRGKPE